MRNEKLIKLILEVLDNEQSKEINCDNQKTESATNHLIDKLVMVRTYSAGVHFGTLKYQKDKLVILHNAHRVFYWANACSLSQLSQEGCKEKNSENKITMAVPEIVLTEAIEIISMPKKTFEALTENLWKV